MEKISDGTAREPYEAPVIEDIPLRAEEQLLAGCKQVGLTPSPINGGNPCFACSVPSAS
jgi:hypothetical protein